MGFEAADSILNLLALMARPEAAASDLRSIIKLHGEWRAAETELAGIRQEHAALVDVRDREQAKADARVAELLRHAEEAERSLANIRDNLEQDEDEWAACKLPRELTMAVH